MRYFLQFAIVCIVFTANPASVFAQKRLTQLSGVIADREWQYPLPYATIEIIDSYRGAVANSQGFFSLVVAVGDTLKFSSLGYKSRIFIVPDTITGIITSIGVFLERDTVLLDVVEIYPWPSRSDFRDAFLALQFAQPEFKMNPIIGIKTQIDTVPKEPTIFNPITLFYESVIAPIEYNRRKKEKVNELPQWK
ncbi:MAG: carboxypeptidase-like regulatory domain-containing protein [Chitinophagales bacterium]